MKRPVSFSRIYSTLTAFGLIALSAYFIVGCAKGRDSSSDTDNPALFGVNGYYPGYYPNGYSQYGLNGQYVLAAQGRVVSNSAYRKFLQGDFCGTIINNSCNPVDGAPIIELSLQSLDIPSGGYVQGFINIRPNRSGYNNVGFTYNNGYMYNTQWSRPLSMRYVNNNTAFEGQVIDNRTPNGFGAYVQVRGTGKPSDSPVTVDIYYQGTRMLTAKLYRVR